MDTALVQKFPFILDRNLAKANCTENRVCTSCDIVVLDIYINIIIKDVNYKIIFIRAWTYWCGDIKGDFNLLSIPIHSL